MTKNSRFLEWQDSRIQDPSRFSRLSESSNSLITLSV